jgi:hypothetical protein
MPEKRLSRWKRVSSRKEWYHRRLLAHYRALDLLKRPSRVQDFPRFFSSDTGLRNSEDVAISFAIWILRSAAASSRRIRLRSISTFTPGFLRRRGDSPFSIPASKSHVLLGSSLELI